MSIERIVRPFQLGDIFNARVLPPDQPVPAAVPDPVVVTWAGKADATYDEEPEAATLGFTVEWQEVTDRRVTETVRVSNPSASSQFVDVEKYKQATFKNTSSGQEQTFKFS